MEQKYSPEDVLEKGWSEKFHRIHQKETVMKSFEKEFHHSKFPMNLTKFRIAYQWALVKNCFWRNKTVVPDKKLEGIFT